MHPKKATMTQAKMVHRDQCLVDQAPPEMQEPDMTAKVEEILQPSTVAGPYLRFRIRKIVFGQQIQWRSNMLVNLYLVLTSTLALKVLGLFNSIKLEVFICYLIY